MTTATQSAHAERIAVKLVNQMPETISKLRPSHTFTYEINEDDFVIFREYPKEIESIIKRGVGMACRLFWNDFKFRHLEGTEKKQAIVKENMSGRNKGMEAFDRINVKLVFYPTVTMRQISPEIEKEPIVLDGRIMAVSGKKGYLKQGSVFCPNDCEAGEAEVFAGPTLRTFIPKCPTCKSKMHLRTSTAITEYVQTIKLQEIQNDGSRKPIDFDVKVVGDDVFNTWIGKRIRVAGHFLTDILLNGSQHEHSQFIFAKYIHEIEEVQNICLTKERADEIKELIQDPVNFKRLCKSFAPKIEGKMLQKETILYVCVGGSEKEVRRKHIHELEIGNAGEGKSEMIKQIPRIKAKSKYILANNATSAGLGIGMVKLDNQTSVPQGGPLVMLSPDGVLGLDELDKMHPEDYKSLLSSMEQGIVTKTVSGTDLSLPSIVSICAAANPKWGQWDESHGIVENINFPAYLLTRFDVITCSVKTNAIMKQDIASKILGLEPVSTEAQILPLISEDELMQYINYCERFQPTLTREARMELKDFYEKMSEITAGEDKVIPMTPRELEGMIRLSTARAKLLQKDVAGVEEVAAIMELKTKAMNTFPGVKVTHAGHQLNLLSEMDKKEHTKESIIQECKDENKQVDRSEVVNKWVEAKIFKNANIADAEFQKMVGETMFLRGSRYNYKY